MTQPSEEAVRVWRTSLNTFCQHGGHVITIPASAEDAAASVIKQALDDQVARIVAHLDAMKRDDTNWPQVIARIIERGEWRST